MKRIFVERLWGMVNRIDSVEKADIAAEFLKECELTNEDWDELMMAVTAQRRLALDIERDADRKPEYRRYA